MSWSAFDSDSALERDVLRRALPLVPSSGQTSARATLDWAANTCHVALAVQETLGTSPEVCVERLGLRPLLTGIAWKVLDLLLEEALYQAGLTPDTPRGWSIKRKVREAAAQTSCPVPLSVAAWKALMACYVATVDVRHSLVHRRAYTDASQALVGVDDAGNALRPLTAGEQETFARAALTAADMVVLATVDLRVEARLLNHLRDLSALHGINVAAPATLTVVPEITVIVDPDPSAGGLYRLDMRAVRDRQPFKTSACIDLVVTPRDRQGQELRGRLEDGPDGAVMLDPHVPPEWLLSNLP